MLDHGARHPDMKQHCSDAFILTCNVSMEYEKAFVEPFAAAASSRAQRGEQRVLLQDCLGA